MARNASQTLTFLNACFFLVRQWRPLIKQIIFQKHCFKDTTLHNNLHILYQQAMKFNMYEVMNSTKQSTVFHTTFL